MELSMNTEILKKHQFNPIVPFDLQKDNVYQIDLTEHNAELHEIDLTNTAVFNEYIFRKIKEENAVCAIGGYLENRYIYRRSEHFQQTKEPRSIHLGVDIWAEAGTPVFAPMLAKVHSFANNDNFGDYGPTIILEHILEGTHFYTLYGHLNLECLTGLYEGKIVETGEKIAEFGNFPINGNWPPHLHFQVITDMLGQKGDFPGVCEPSKQQEFAKICLNANLLLM
ncbi:MAG: peptidoglycan DD-metalloendopeptidase family protein [Bacteroidota bacterium]